MTNTEFTQLDSDEAVLRELGRRLAQRRLDLQLTQEDLAEQAGVGKRTVERIEAGASAQMTSLVRTLRVLDLLSGLDLVFPESGPRPMDLLKREGKRRRRASPRRRQDNLGQPWTWDDER